MLKLLFFVHGGDITFKYARALISAHYYSDVLFLNILAGSYSAGAIFWGIRCRIYLGEPFFVKTIFVSFVELSV